MQVAHCLWNKLSPIHYFLQDHFIEVCACAHTHTHTYQYKLKYGKILQIFLLVNVFCILSKTKNVVRRSWYEHGSIWGADILISKYRCFLYGGDIWTSISVHIIPFQITSLQLAALCFRGKITLPIFVPTTFCCYYIYTGYFQMLKLCPQLSYLGLSVTF